jgi:hypothetical protein
MVVVSRSSSSHRQSRLRRRRFAFHVEQSSLLQCRHLMIKKGRLEKREGPFSKTLNIIVNPKCECGFLDMDFLETKSHPDFD